MSFKKLLCFFGLIIFFFSVCFIQASSQTQQNIVVVTDDDNNKKINIEEGQTLIVKLKYTSGTGYDWNITKIDANLLEPVGEPTFEIAVENMPGSAGSQIFQFKAKSTGATVLQLDYLRPWEKNKPSAETYLINIEITALKTKYEAISIKIEKKIKSYSITANYPQIKNFPDKKTQNKFNKEILKYVNKNINQFKKDFKNSDKIQKRVPWSFILDCNVKSQSNNLISVYFLTETYEGGAHPDHAVYTLNYDLKNNKKLNLADLFKPGSDYLNIVSKYCIEYLLQKNMPDSDWINKGASAKQENYKNFYLTGENLVIVFPRYQVACYAEGEQEVAIPYTYLKDILNPNGIISF